VHGVATTKALNARPLNDLDLAEITLDKSEVYVTLNRKGVDDEITNVP
jgi:hypothetical protein